MSRPIKMTRLSTLEKFQARLEDLGLTLSIDPATTPDGPLASGFDIEGHAVGNRFAVLPMEGWDATPDGRPTDLVKRRWSRFGQSGAKLVWGGEAYAVDLAGRANPNQLGRNPSSDRDLAELHALLISEHLDQCGTTDDLLVGLQLTHSGRFSRPDGTPAPRVAFRHPVLDARVGVDSDNAVLSDGELEDLIESYVAIARNARDAGFKFVDIKACHGYLGHELLSARERKGRYGGDLAGRSQFLLDTIAAVRSEAPELLIGVRLSIFDVHPFRSGEAGVGCADPSPHQPFGATQSGDSLDLAETHELLDLLVAAGVKLLCSTAGSPYYNPHIQRPAFYPPSDGYDPPEDPLVGVTRQIDATRELKLRHPELCFVGSGYSYLQEWAPNVAQAVVREGAADSIGLGRMMLSYPQMPRDILEGRPLERPLICRTFSDCTTAPRNGLLSGCYPIDPFYKRHPHAETLAEYKKKSKAKR